MNRRIALALGIAVTTGTACARYEYVNETQLPECRDRVRLRPPTAVRWVAGERQAPDVIAGRVVDTAGVAVLGAQVLIASDTTHAALRPETPRTVTDSLGRFRVDSVSPGRYGLIARRIGYKWARGMIDVPTDGAALVTMDIDIIDGPCSGMATLRIRKPFWKLW
jgi:hypothetical protein